MSTNTFNTFGETNAGNFGPNFIPFTPKYNNANNTATGKNFFGFLLN
nr:hypothetical protein [Marinitoga sp. 1154]